MRDTGAPGRDKAFEVAVSALRHVAASFESNDVCKQWHLSHVSVAGGCCRDARDHATSLYMSPNPQLCSAFVGEVALLRKRDRGLLTDLN